MSGNLKADLKKAFQSACSKEGYPPIIDKTINSVYDEFKKSQPLKLAEKGLSDQWKEHIDIWVNLKNCIEKYIENKKIAALAISSLKKIYGETPSETQVRLMVT